MEAEIKLVTYTALAFTVEANNEQIQALRKLYDPAYQRWQPHINFCFPFVDRPFFPNAFNILQDRLQTVPPFDITFKKMDCFPHGTVFLVPETEGNQLSDIYQIITTAIPELKDKKEFHPHMTVGKFPKGVVNARCAELSQGWKEWKLRCDGICMIEREKDTPFQTYRKIEFKG